MLPCVWLSFLFCLHSLSEWIPTKNKNNNKTTIMIKKYTKFVEKCVSVNVIYGAGALSLMSFRQFHYKLTSKILTIAGFLHSFFTHFVNISKKALLSIEKYINHQDQSQNLKTSFTFIFNILYMIFSNHSTLLETYWEPIFLMFQYFSIQKCYVKQFVHWGYLTKL